MAINFDVLPNQIICQEAPVPSRSVLEEINARQGLLKERHIKCTDIGPLYEEPRRKPHRYTYRYFCVCPHYNPQYRCQHIGNVIIDRDVLTSQEHITHLATPKESHAAPRRPPRFYQRKYIIPNCTARINSLAKPDKKRVAYALTNFKHLLNSRHQQALAERLAQKPTVECISIPTALDWLEEERRLRAVAKRMEKMRCQKVAKKIVNKQRSQIKKIICVLFEEMKDFLLNDQFIMDESSSLVMVILETLREFTDKEFCITSNLREYQKILAFNLAVWINKFISNLNIHVAETPAITQAFTPEAAAQERPPAELLSFLPVEDYIPAASASESEYHEDYECKIPQPTVPQWPPDRIMHNCEEVYPERKGAKPPKAGGGKRKK